MNYLLFISAGLAIGLHIFIFYLETLAWTSSLTRRIFGLTEQESIQTRVMAANQGVYNLLFAGIVLSGVVLYLFGQTHTGLILVIAGCGSMTLAALYLFLSSDKKGAATKQLVFPLIATITACILLS
jgi:putative membrane protein